MSRTALKAFPIEVPQFQNWSCHGCTDCCRGHLLIVLSPEEQARIRGQAWTTADGIDPSTVFVEEGGQTRLGHRPDGACVFLDPTGRCRIHSKFGEPAKPLACRLYPLALHPAGNKLVVSLRFSCPSAAANRGKPLADQLPAIRQLATEIVPDDFASTPPPPVVREPVEDWDDFLRYLGWLDRILAIDGVPIVVKLLRALHWLKAIQRARFDQLTDDSADEILEPLFESAAQKVPEVPTDLGRPSRFGRFLFRTMVLQCAQPATIQDLQQRGSYRLRRLGALWRFTRATGEIPNFGASQARIPFSAVERSFGPLPAAAEATLTRFFRAKVRGLDCCGRAFYDLPLHEGFATLALALPLILWLARWHAATEGRTTLNDTDVVRGITAYDYHHGAAPRPLAQALRLRTHLLAQRSDVERLCAWYAR